MNERQAGLLKLLEENERITISQMKEQYDVSEMTLRRDITFLEEMGYVTKIQGGVMARRKLFFERSFNERERNHQDEKRAIAKEAVRLIEPGENIILDTGTTTLYLARELVKKNLALTVATTSLIVASTLFNSNIEVMLLGGFLRKETPDLIGPLVEKNLKEFHADRLFIGCDGIIVDDGFYTSDLNICHIEATMVQKADTVILITDSSKFGKKSFVRCGEIEKVDIVITDGNVDPDSVKILEERGVKAIIA
jgi:DeoR family fructose operon transcriptional repressor